MPRATTASILSAMHMATRIGTKGMYSSAMPIVDEPTANRVVMPPTSRIGRPPSALIAAPIAASMAPVARMTPIAPPTRKTKKMISAAASSPRGTLVRAACQGRGAASTAWYVPASTWRPSRSYSPAGSR